MALSLVNAHQDWPVVTKYLGGITMAIRMEKLYKQAKKTYEMQLIAGEGQGNRLRNNREQKTRKNGFYSTKFGEDRHATLAMTERRSHYQHLNRVTARNEAVLLSVSDCPEARVALAILLTGYT